MSLDLLKTDPAEKCAMRSHFHPLLGNAHYTMRPSWLNGQTASPLPMDMSKRQRALFDIQQKSSPLCMMFLLKRARFGGTSWTPSIREPKSAGALLKHSMQCRGKTAGRGVSKSAEDTVPVIHT